MNYKSDPIGSECLSLASRSKSSMRFGAVLVDADGNVIGRGWNRRSKREERIALSHVDYAIHAEQAALFDAMKNGHDVSGSTVYVLGYAEKTGQLTTRSEVSFGCRKCPNNFIAHNVSVHIPHQSGWVLMTPEEAMSSGNEFHGRGTWDKFARGEVSL